MGGVRWEGGGQTVEDGLGWIAGGQLRPKKKVAWTGIKKQNAVDWRVALYTNGGGFGRFEHLPISRL